ncbi:MAG: hypothetical protein ACPLPS_06200 [bacterium]
MKIRFKQDYLFGRNPMKKGDVIEVPELVAIYLVEDIKVAEYIKEGDASGKGAS